MLDVYVPNLLSMKSFHRILAGNAHEYQLKSRIGKARYDAIAEIRMEKELL
jgi:hypothetical protein